MYASHPLVSLLVIAIFYSQVGGILLTSGYSAKIFFIGFVSLPVGYRLLHSFTHEVPSIASGILSVLVLGSILVGFLLQDLFTGSSTDIYWSTFLVDHRSYEYLPLEANLKIHHDLPLLLVGSSFMTGAAVFLSGRLLVTRLELKSLVTFFGTRWTYDRTVNQTIAYPVTSLGYWLSFKLVDKGIFDLIGATGSLHVIYHRASLGYVILHSGSLTKLMKLYLVTGLESLVIWLVILELLGLIT